MRNIRVLTEKKKAIITGVGGQDGSYLAELLLRKGYEVHGLIRPSSTDNRSRIAHITEDTEILNKSFFLHEGDLLDQSFIGNLLAKIRPDEFYNLAAQSHVGNSFTMPGYTADVSGVAALHILDAIVKQGLKTRFYQASTSELYGLVQETPQRETTPFYPRSPYACAKLFAYWTTVNHREAYNVFACNGILFNHESPRRGEAFVTRKITRAIARIMAGKQQKLQLGNIEAKRDWGFAKDYVEAMWMMLQQDHPQDFVIATGETHSVREFLELAFSCVGLDWQKYVEYDPRYCRPSEVDLLLGDPSKAERVLGWKPKMRFEELVRLMVQEDLKLEGVHLESKDLEADRYWGGYANALAQVGRRLSEARAEESESQVETAELKEAA